MGEYQTLGLFAILGVMTLMTVLLFKVVLFAPQSIDKSRSIANESALSSSVPTINAKENLKK